MGRLVTIKAPVEPKKAGDPTTMDITGYVVYLYVGRFRHKFLLQNTSTNEVFLTDYASGLKIGSLTPIKLRSARSYQKITDRSAAMELLSDLVDRLGEDTLRYKLNNAPAIN